ncbi:MAG: hypothetical protein HY897_25410 [Deltaproteobacteria bacterium]|nr:hypothetical protein [Deltaproteobacteria bacterium]
MEPGLANLMTEVIIDNVAKLNRYQVIGQKDIEKMVFWEQNKQLQGCNDTSCLVQIAGAMGAEYYVEGSVGAVGSQFVLTLKWIDAREISVLRRTTKIIEKNEDVLMRTVVPIVDELFVGEHVVSQGKSPGSAPASTAPPFAPAQPVARSQASPPEPRRAESTQVVASPVVPRRVPERSAPRPAEQISPQKPAEQAVIRTELSKPVDTEPAVAAGEGSPSWYKTWWFWTALGAVAVGAGVGTYFLVAGDSPDHVSVKTNWQQ